MMPRRVVCAANKYDELISVLHKFDISKVEKQYNELQINDKLLNVKQSFQNADNNYKILLIKYIINAIDEFILINPEMKYYNNYFTGIL